MILYFTGTGNSRYCAEKLAEITGDALLCINECMRAGTRRIAYDDGRIIFVTPTYAWRMPGVIKDWITKTVFAGEHKVWFVMTCGGEIGNAAPYNQALAKLKNMEYMGTAGIKMPDNYILMFPDISQEKANELLSEAQPAIERVGEQLRRGERFGSNRKNAYDMLMSSAVNVAFRANVKADGFYTSPACVGCGKCAELCPLKNITIIDGVPVWGKKCTHCMACISYCPEKAIEFKNKTQGKRRYTFEGYFDEEK